MVFDVVVIGAGRCWFDVRGAGRAMPGRRVLVLDHANKAGKKKILMSGGRPL